VDFPGISNREWGTLTPMSIAVILLGTLLIAIAIAWAVGPGRLVAGLTAVPVTWAVVFVAALAVWAVLRLHGR
jgi:hypothetical protein